MFSRITSDKHVLLKNFGGHGTVQFLGQKKGPRHFPISTQQQQYQHHNKGEGKEGTKRGKGSKGGGKGYQGTCWRCGQVGHKAAECTKLVHFVEEASLRRKSRRSRSAVSGWLAGWMVTGGLQEADHEDERGRCVHWRRGEHEEVRVRETNSIEDGVSVMKFHVAKVQRPPASAAKIVKAGSRISMVPKKRTVISRTSTLANRCKHALKRVTYMFDVQFKNGSGGTMTLIASLGSQ